MTGIVSRSFAMLAASTTLLLGGCDFFVSAEARMQKASQLRTQGNHRAAAIELKKLLQKDPDNRDARLLLGEISLLTGEAAAAEKELRRARELGVQKDRVVIPLGQALLIQGRFDSALQELDPSGIETADTRKAALMLRGEAYLAKGQLDQAEHAFREAVGSGTQLPDARIGLARIEQRRGNLEGAQAHVEQALSEAPQHVRAWVAKGELAMVRGQYALAEEAFAGALGLPAVPVVEEFMARSGLAESQWRQGKSDAALQSVERLLALGLQHPRPKYFRALIAFSAGDYQTAKDNLQQVLRSFPDYRPAALLLGATHYAQGELEQADMYLSSVLAAEPSSVPARKLLAATRLRQDKPQDAMATLTPALARDSNDGQLLALMGKASLQAGHADTGLLYLERGARSDPGNQALQMELASSYVTAGDLGRAIELLEDMPETRNGTYGREVLLILAYLRKGDQQSALAQTARILATRPDDAGAHNLAGNVYMVAGQMPRAREHFERALQLQPDDPTVLMNLGRLELTQGKQDRARARFERVLEVNPKNTSAMLALTLLAEQRGDTAGVAQWLERASAAQPQALAPKLLLVRHYVGTRELERARGIAGELEKAEPDNAEVQNVLGIVQMAEGKFEEAAARFRKAVAAAPRSPDFLYNLARAERALERPGEAKKALTKTLALQPDHLPATALLATLEMRDGNAEQALARARGLQRHEASAPAGHALEGDLHMMQQDYEDAARAYDVASEKASNSLLVIRSYQARSRANRPDATKPLDEWLTRHPDDGRVRLVLARAYQVRGEHGKAAAEYEVVLQKHPGDAVTLNNLAWLYHEMDDPRAVETAARAHQAAPDNGAVTDTLGWLLVHDGQIEQGLELLRKAAVQAPDIPEIRYHLAVALAKSGAREEARRTLRELVASGKNFEALAAAKQLLGQL